MSERSNNTMSTFLTIAAISMAFSACDISDTYESTSQPLWGGTTEAPGYEGSRFGDVWAQVASDPYSQLPQQTVTVGSFFSGWHNKLTRASKRTLARRDDLLPRFDKLLHPNGLCARGTWRITASTPYTGYFATGAEGLIIGRASAALSATLQGQYRSLGFAGKIFPTLDEDERVKTANFFTIDDLGGTLTDHYLDTGLTNDIIHISVRPSSVFDGPVGVVVAQSFMTADRTFNVAQTLIRQLYPVSTIGVDDADNAETPVWLMITGAADVPRVDRADFRDELDINNYPGGLAFEIWAAHIGTRLGWKDWKLIGRIDIDDTVASDSCDHRLHFSHPKHR